MVGGAEQQGRQEIRVNRCRVKPRAHSKSFFSGADSKCFVPSPLLPTSVSSCTLVNGQFIQNKCVYSVYQRVPSFLSYFFL